MWSRPARSLALLSLSLLVTTCGPKSAPRVSPEPADLLVLVPDPEGGSVGRATVSDRFGSVDLVNAWDSTEVTSHQAPSAVSALDEAKVTAMFPGLLAALPPAPRHFTLYFQFGSDELTAESRAEMKAILEVVKSRPSPDLIVVGHTDTTGTPVSNFELGLQRARIVQALLVADGIDQAAVSVTSHGEGDLLIRTPDETYEPRNRRVEIDVQ